MWVRHFTYRGNCHPSKVSIHAPVWVRPRHNGYHIVTTKFQFTHPCGCDFFVHRYYLTPAVSIHAPVWVRLYIVYRFRGHEGFQFTHPCGCDNHQRQTVESQRCFNSRTRVGATFCQAYGLPLYEVSIHAPVWVRRPDEYGLSIKHATKVLRQPDARTRCGQA